jgi:hypothetical protein
MGQNRVACLQNLGNGHRRNIWASCEYCRWDVYETLLSICANQREDRGIYISNFFLDTFRFGLVMKKKGCGIKWPYNCSEESSPTGLIDMWSRRMLLLLLAGLVVSFGSKCFRCFCGRQGKPSSFFHTVLYSIRRRQHSRWWPKTPREREAVAHASLYIPTKL